LISSSILYNVGDDFATKIIFVAMVVKIIKAELTLN